MKHSIPAFFLVLTGLIFSRCSKDKNTTPPLTLDCSTVTNKAFAANVSPLIQSSCAIAGCHAAGSNNGPGALITYSQISAASSRIRTSVANGTMPKGNVISTAEKNSILCWIDSGSPNN